MKGPRRRAPLAVILLAVLVPLLGRTLLRGPKQPPAEVPRRGPAAAPVPRGSATVPPAAQPAAGDESGPRIPVNEEHLFAGEVNRKGRPVGFHSRPNGRDPEGARLVDVLDGPNAAGVYTAEVEIRDPRSGQWLRKTSTFYPDRMQRPEVLQAIVNAFEGRQGDGERFRGPSGAGFTIEGYYQNGRINTAYPIYSRR